MSRKPSQAERYVDDVTTHRIMVDALGLTQSDLEGWGFGKHQIKARHLSGKHRVEDWDTRDSLKAIRFEDGSIARQTRDTKRWEVYREW